MYMRTFSIFFLILTTSFSLPILAKEELGKPHVGTKSLPLSPMEAQKKFTVPKGFEVRIFASEPDVANPIGMSFDEKGRLWIVEGYEYPYEKKKGETRKGRDRVICLEDPDGTGKATKRTVVVEDLWLASGICYGNGGIYVGQAPYLLFYPITETPTGPKAGERQILLTGFGLDDKHELINSLCWGPDGWLYFTQGVFTHSNIVNPTTPDAKPIPFDAGVGRYHPKKQIFEVWADGISNQWGIDWDKDGNAFVSACVIDHIWHVVHGGVYKRQGGTPNVPYTYDLLGSINKDGHRHHMAAYAGINIYQGNLFPKEYLGTAFMGNIHGNCIDQDKLTPDGSSFRATDMRTKDQTGEFLEANDDWFRPVSTQTGPDGALWIMDWYDKYPCYQNSKAPDLDRERGRIWRVVYVGNEAGKVLPTHEKGMDINALKDDDLVKMLTHNNVWQRRTAQRIFTERFSASDKLPAILKLITSDIPVQAKQAMVWTGADVIYAGDMALLNRLAESENPATRAWVARLAGEELLHRSTWLRILEKLAADSDPAVLAAVAESTRLLTSQDTSKIISSLINHPDVINDPHIPFLIWRAVEVQLMRPGNSAEFLSKLATTNDHAQRQINDNSMLQIISKKSIRRLIDANDKQSIEMVIAMLNTQKDHPRMTAGFIEGLLESQKSRGGKRPAGTEKLDIAGLSSNKDKEIANFTLRLAAIWGDAAAIENGLAPLASPNASDADKINALQLAQQISNDATRSAVAHFMQSNPNDGLKLIAIRTLGTIGDDNSATTILDLFKSLSPQSRRDSVEILLSRLTWTKMLLKAVENKQASKDDFSASALRTLSKQKDEGVQVMFKKVIGTYHAPDASKEPIIAAKRKIMEDGKPVDYKAGHELAQKTCLVCHTFFGEGMHVGPDLTGSGRANLDALLHNVIDPNEVIGAGYENTMIETKDNRTLAGRLIEETPDHVKLLGAGDKEDVIAKSDIATRRTEKISVMPEGLIDQMKDDEVRNLLSYILHPPQEQKK